MFWLGLFIIADMELDGANGLATKLTRKFVLTNLYTFSSEEQGILCTKSFYKKTVLHRVSLSFQSMVNLYTLFIKHTKLAINRDKHICLLSRVYSIYRANWNIRSCIIIFREIKWLL